MPRPRAFVRRHPAVWRCALAVGAVLCAFYVLSCVAPRPWQPYAPPPPERKAELDRRKGEHEQLSRTCIECHREAGDPHREEHVTCVDCHGGDGTQPTKEKAHPQPTFPSEWLSAANPERPYMLTMAESRDWIRFVNPGDLRVANETCGACHTDITLNVMKSVMTTSAHFWGSATYVNGIVANKRTVFGESYDPNGTPQRVNHLIAGPSGPRLPTDEEVALHGWTKAVVPLPHWEVTQPGNVYRVFEKGSRLGGVGLGFNGLAAPIPGLPDKLEDPGRPNNRLSDRGLGTLNRVDLPTLNVHKTRLNDPNLSLFGTNDQPGDYRSSGCTACHMVYANDRDPVHSGPWARYGNRGHGNAAVSPWGGEQVPPDPTIRSDEPGHPVLHRFTRAIPSSQCMVCHMHQPNAFVNSYYGYQMWTYETDGEPMWPEQTRELSHAERFAILDRNPEEAAQRGKWGDVEFLADVAEDVNPKLQHTQFADYHGHGWIFRAVLKTDRKGNLLDREGQVVPYDDPDKLKGLIPPLGAHPVDVSAFAPAAGKPVHLKDIHAEKGMHCVDCHFEPDVHGDGHLHAEYQAAVQIRCQDCHGTAEEYAQLRPSGPSAKARAALGEAVPRLDLAEVTTPFGTPRFERRGGAIVQRSMLDPNLEWEVSQVKDSVDPASAHYNRRAAYAKLQQASDGSCAHAPEKMDCAACHTSWVTSCFGCHLPQQANWRSDMHHFERQKLRNLASYNPQVARDDAFMLGISPDVKENKVAVVRSSSAVIISSQDAQRRIIYKQQPTVAANGMNGQCFNTHFAHTVRKTETRKCSDCHLSTQNDNNAWLAQTYLLGTNYVNFFGVHAYVGVGDDGIEAVQWTEWEEPQAVIGSNLHRMAFPAEFQDHVARGRQLTTSVHHSGTDVQSVELRGEYLYTASGGDGFRVFDVANVANKDFSEKIVTAPVSPLGQDTHVPSRYATAVALPTNMAISMGREVRPENREQVYDYRGRQQNLHESYRYAYVSDRYEGLIVVDVDCLNDGDPTNNFLQRALTFNPGGQLDGAESLTVAGTTVYVCCARGLVAVSIDDPLAPRVLAEVGAPALVRPTSVAVQLRYAFVTDAEGLKVLDVTWPERMRAVPGAAVQLGDARDVYVARTYAYVANGSQGLAIVDVERPDQPRLLLRYDADGRIDDLNQVKVGMAYDSLYALLADGRNGLHVLQLVTPEDGGRSAYGFAPEPRPAWIATYPTDGPALAVAKGLDRDRAVDESGHQVAIFGRIGGRPFTLEEMRRLMLVGGEPGGYADAVPEGWEPPPPAAGERR